ncbi:hypothetical protein O9992_24315 [Vibrio lentus]|nr:hypothetical protein [Vibrio lentus]
MQLIGSDINIEWRCIGMVTSVLKFPKHLKGTVRAFLKHDVGGILHYNNLSAQLPIDPKRAAVSRLSLEIKPRKRYIHGNSKRLMYWTHRMHDVVRSGAAIPENAVDIRTLELAGSGKSFFP